MIGLILGKLQRLIDAKAGAETEAKADAKTDEASILPDRAPADFRAPCGSRHPCQVSHDCSDETHAVVSHWQDMRSRTLRFAGDFPATVNRLIDRVDYKKMRPSLYWPYCS